MVLDPENGNFEILLKGRVWKFGDDVAVHQLIPSQYDSLVVANKHAELASHVLDAIEPTFRERVQKGDLIVAGKRFGGGKHQLGVINALTKLGVAAFLAESINPVFQRTAIDSGVPAIVCKVLPSKVETGDLLELNLRTGHGVNITKNVPISETPAPSILLSILEAGGLEAYTLRRIGVHTDASQS